METRTVRGAMYSTDFQILLQEVDGWLPDYMTLPDPIGRFVKVAPGFVNILMQSNYRYVGITVKQSSCGSTNFVEPQEGCDADVEFDVTFDRPAQICGLEPPPVGERPSDELADYRIEPGHYRLRVQLYGAQSAIDERNAFYAGKGFQDQSLVDLSGLTEQLVLYLHRIDATSTGQSPIIHTELPY